MIGKADDGGISIQARRPGGDPAGLSIVLHPSDPPRNDAPHLDQFDPVIPPQNIALRSAISGPGHVTIQELEMPTVVAACWSVGATNLCQRRALPRIPTPPFRIGPENHHL